MKTCAKCGGPIPAPVLGEDSQERCPLCGDEPPSPAELAALLMAAMEPLIKFRDRGLDLDGMDEDDPLHDAAEDLDAAFDRLDSCLRWLEDPE